MQASVSSAAGALADEQQDDAGGELFTEFAVAPEDVFGDDVHIPDLAGEVVEDNGFIFKQAAHQHKDSPDLPTSSLTFKCEPPAVSKRYDKGSYVVRPVFWMAYAG